MYSKKNRILCYAFTLLPFFVGLILWGTAREAAFPAALLLSPVFLALTLTLCLYLSERLEKDREKNKKINSVVIWTIPLLSNVTSWISFSIAAGHTELPIPCIMGWLFAVIYLVMGNYLPKCRQNSTVGIRVKWTASTEENWNATHRFAGKVWVIGGLIMVLAALLPEVPGIIVTVLAVAALSILPIAYSYRYHRIHGTKSEPDPLSKKISVGMLIFTAVIVVFVAVMLFTGNLHYRFDSDSFTVEPVSVTHFGFNRVAKRMPKIQ